MSDLRYLVRSISGDADRLTGQKKSARSDAVASGLLPPTFKISAQGRAWWNFELIEIAEARARGDDDEAIRAIVLRQVKDRASKRAA